MRFKYYYVYIAKCIDGKYYAGFSNDPERRIEEHNSGLNPKSFTYKRRPVELVYCQEFRDPLDGIAFEKQIQKWTRKKKEALINGNWKELQKLSVCKNETNHVFVWFDSAHHDKQEGL